MLENINSPSDLKKLNIDELPTLCSEIRSKLLSDVTTYGGHLSSNLGAVELTVALHYVYDDEDKIVWDVGHQSYVHKLITGRYSSFDTLRQKNGISGFPDTLESKYDCFDTGHASTSISAALGIATARDLQGDDYNVIAVVGDGALTGGMTYEALNNINNRRLLVVLNDNKMSIDRNVGTATKNLSKIRVGKYDKRKEKIKKAILHIPLIGKGIYNILRKIKRHTKLRLLHNLYFDNFKIKYVGPLDGNDVKELVYYFSQIKLNVTKPTVVHLLTKKGKGYVEAEENPSKYHGIASENAVLSNTITDIVSQTLCEIAEKDNKVVAVTAAMTAGTGLSEFAIKYPDRFFDVGIAEEHAVTFCAGLASSGMKPYFCVYSTFLQRGFDQILHDVALQKLHVVFCIDHAGFVGSDGKTHQGLFDLSYLTLIPNITVLTPATTRQLKEMLLWSSEQNGAIAIRYPKSIDIDYELPFCQKWNIVEAHNGRVKLLCVGNNFLSIAYDISNALRQMGITSDIICVTSVKPLDETYLNSVSNCLVVTLEENTIFGGFGSCVCQNFSTNSGVRVLPIAVEDKFVEHATIKQQFEITNLTVKEITSKILLALDK